MVSRFAPNGAGEASVPSPAQVVAQLRGMHLMISATIKSKRRTCCRINTNYTLKQFFVIVRYLYEYEYEV